MSVYLRHKYHKTFKIKLQQDINLFTERHGKYIKNAQSKKVTLLQESKVL